MTKSLPHIQEQLETILRLMGFSFEVEAKIDETKKEVCFCVHVSEGQHYLIGKQGANLEAVQQLLRNLQQKAGDEFRYSVDVNHYLAGKKRQLQQKVSQLVEEAGTEQSEIQLWPMSAFERRIVHELFVNDDHFQTESVGQGTDRKITIKKIH